MKEVEEKVDGALESVPNGATKTEENPNLMTINSQQKLDRLQEIVTLSSHPLYSDTTKLRGVAEMLEAAYIQPAYKKGVVDGQNNVATVIKEKIEVLLKETPKKNKGQVEGLKKALNIFNATN